MSSSNPTDAARFNLFNILIGIAIAFAMEDLLKDTKQFTLISVQTINTASFVLLAIIFYHGKIATTESSHHLDSLIGRPTIALLDYVLHFAVVVTIVIGAFLLKDLRDYTHFNIWLRALDFVLTLFLACFVSGQSSRLELRAQMSWLTFNVVSGLIYLFVFLNYDQVVLRLAELVSGNVPPAILAAAGNLNPAQLGEIALAIALLAIILLDVVMDATINRQYYVGSSRDDS